MEESTDEFVGRENAFRAIRAGAEGHGQSGCAEELNAWQEWGLWGDLVELADVGLGSAGGDVIEDQVESAEVAEGLAIFGYDEESFEAVGFGEVEGF